MKILVYGAGAIGTMFGGFLAKGGEDVVLLGRHLHMEAIKARGLDIEGIWGRHHIEGIKCYTNSTEVKDEHAGSFDIILLTVKSYDTVSSMAQIRNIAGINTYVLSLQNGIGNVEAVAQAVGEEQTIGGRVITGVETPNPGTVRVTVSADDVVIGRLSSKTPEKAVDDIAAAFTASGIKTRTTDEIGKFIWEKVIYNCALNALGSILGVTYGQLLESEYSRDLMRRVVAEIYAVSQKKNIELEYKTKEEYVKVLFNKLVPMTSAHKPSMLQDIEKKKRTEIDFLNGVIVQLGKETGVPTPANQILLELIKYKERKTL